MCDIAALVLSISLALILRLRAAPNRLQCSSNYFRCSSNHSPNISPFGRTYDVLPNSSEVLPRATSYRSCICRWHLRQNTACGSQWLIYMLTAWLCLADTHEFQSGVADWSHRLGFDAYAIGRSTNLCAKLHKLSKPYPQFFYACVINQRVANGYDHCKTILLCLKTIYGRMIVGWYWATKLALGAE